MNTKQDTIAKLNLLEQQLIDLIEDAKNDFDMDELKSVLVYIDSKNLEIGVAPILLNEQPEQREEQESCEYFPLIEFFYFINEEEEGLINYDYISELASRFVFVR